jgi:LysM repeat protein
VDEQTPGEQAQETAVETEPAPTSVGESPTAIPVPTPVPTLPPVEAVILQPYTVQAVDTLFSIATRPDTSIALMAQYGLSQDDLVPGAVIDLPVGNPAYCPQADRQPYAIGEGDTAFSIGRKFNSSAEELREMNNLDASYTVYAATIICVPLR